MFALKITELIILSDWTLDHPPKRMIPFLKALDRSIVMPFEKYCGCMDRYGNYDLSDSMIDKYK